MKRLFSSLGGAIKRRWDGLYAKVRGLAKGYVVGGGAAALVTELLAEADTTDLSTAERVAWTVGVAAILGALNAYRTPETGPKI